MKEKIRKKAEWKAGIMNFNSLSITKIKERLFVGKFDIFTDEEKNEIILNGIYKSRKISRLKRYYGIENYKP